MRTKMKVPLGKNRGREIHCLYYIPSVSCYSSVARERERGSRGEGQAQEGIPGHKRFTSPPSTNPFLKQEQYVHPVGEEME